MKKPSSYNTLPEAWVVALDHFNEVVKFTLKSQKQTDVVAQQEQVDKSKIINENQPNGGR